MSTEVLIEPSWNWNEQKWWLAELEKRNWRAVVCNGADEAIAEIDKYLGDGKWNSLIFFSRLSD